MKKTLSQGDQRDPLVEELKRRCYAVRLSGRQARIRVIRNGKVVVLA